MIFLFVTVFIAQLVILVQIGIWTVNTCNKINELSEKVTNNQARLQKIMGQLHQITDDMTLILPHLKRKIMRKYYHVLLSLLNKTVQSSILVFFKPKYKKILLGIKVGLGLARRFSKS